MNMLFQHPGISKYGFDELGHVTQHVTGNCHHHIGEVQEPLEVGSHLLEKSDKLTLWLQRSHW